MRGENDSKNLKNSFGNTLKLYNDHFGNTDNYYAANDIIDRCPNFGRINKENHYTSDTIPMLADVV